MANGMMREAVRQLRRAALLQDSGQTDAQLLESFLCRREEASFEALVRRHGPMVLSVCRRVLHDPHDAEDAFQATFLVLARRAAAVVPRAQVGSWLYGVAYRTALKARTARARRRKHERQALAASCVRSSEDSSWPDLRALLDRELQRLPDAYRASVVLCDLEGRTKREAARQLGVPEGTLSSRLARGRAMLRARLARRGVALSLGALAASASGVSARLVASTVGAATRAAAGQDLTAAVSATVAALTEGMVKAMVMRKVLTALAVVLAVCLVGLGVGVGVCRTRGAETGEAEERAEASRRPVPKPERKGEDVPKEMLLPPECALILALVSLDDKDRLTVRVRMTRPDGSDGLETLYYDRAQAQVYEGGGKAVPPKALRRLLKQEALAFVAFGERTVDPAYLRLLKEGTLVFLLPEPKPEAPQPPPKLVPAAPLPALTPAPEVGVFVIDRRDFEVPFRLDPGERRVKEVILYLSTDQGRTWQKVAVSPPSEKSFHFHAAADGLYWFSVGTITENGLRDPADNTPRVPGLKVKVETSRREPPRESAMPSSVSWSTNWIRWPRSEPPRESAMPSSEKTDTQAEKDFNTAEFYRRTGTPDSATYYYEIVRRRYPGTTFAEKAAERLRGLPRERRQPAGGETPPVRVGQIIIAGNRKTPDHVILEQLPLFPGQLLNNADLRVAERNLERLGLFRARPRVAVIGAEAPGEYRDILIHVEEK